MPLDLTDAALNGAERIILELLAGTIDEPPRSEQWIARSLGLSNSFVRRHRANALETLLQEDPVRLAAWEEQCARAHVAQMTHAVAVARARRTLTVTPTRVTHLDVSMHARRSAR